MRPRLVDRLCAVLSRKLALVVAPTGSGKTTLLVDACQSLRMGGITTIWLTLDRCEFNPRYFLDHLAIALHQALPGVGQDALAMLQGDNSLSETVIGSLINDLTETEAPVVLFLDDFQEVDCPEVANLIAYLLRYLPANIHLVLASQREFPLSLAWAHARDWTIEFGWRDLQLSVDEVRAYLQETRNLVVSDELVADLTVHTEGWACAVQLAANALSQQMTELPRRTGADFADVLLEDLFFHQPAALQRFLLDTSLLSRLSPSLCDTVTDSQSGRECLAELERAHFFVQRLDQQGDWLRYHSLFVGFLRKSLRAREPERAVLLHRRAGNWYAANGYINEALNHWLAAGAVDQAADLLIVHGQTLLRNAEMRELEAWLTRLPAETIAASPVLSTLRAWCALHHGQPLVVRLATEEAEHAFATNPAGARPNLPQECELLRALAAYFRFDWLDCAALPRNLSLAFDESQPVQRAFAHIMSGQARRCAGDLAGARMAFMEAVDLADASVLLSPNHIARFGLVMVDLLRAQPLRALESLSQWFGDPSRRAYWRNGASAFLRTLQALALIDQDRLDDAGESIEEAIVLLEGAGTFSFYGVSLVVRARYRSITGRTDEAMQDLALARASALTNHVERTVFRADLVESAIRIQTGELSKAERLLEHARQILDESCQIEGENVEAWQSMQCEWLLASHRNIEAEELALSGENSARIGGRTRYLISFLIYRAIALQSRPGGIAPAWACLNEAKKLAEPGGVRLPFRLLAQALDPLTAPAEQGKSYADLLPMPNTLHQREAQILRLLEQGLRNKEIANRLFLSEETVKWYLKRLYDNFSVDNRVQLLARVRKLGLLGDHAA